MGNDPQQPTTPEQEPGKVPSEESGPTKDQLKEAEKIKKDQEKAQQEVEKRAGQ